MAPIAVSASESARLYVPNAERREAGREHQLTSWLTATALLELEWLSQSLRSAGGETTDRSADWTATLQLGLIADLWEGAGAELVLEYDSGGDEVVVDEGFLGLEAEHWDMEIGRLYTPLGIYSRRTWVLR